MIDVPQQLRQRREASQRCEPLNNGHRDPFDALAQSGRRRAAWITTEPERVLVLVKGRGCAEPLRRAGLNLRWSGVARGYLLDAWRLPDAVAALEWAGYRVHVREVAA